MPGKPSKKNQVFTCLLFCFLFTLFAWSLETGTGTSGRSLYNQGRFQEAREVLEKAVDTGQVGIPEKTLLGMIYTRLKEYDRARKVLLSAHQQDPHNPEILYALGMLESAIGEYEASSKWLNMANNKSENLQQTKKLWVDSLINRSIEQYREGNSEASEEALKEALQLDAYNPVVIAMLIQLYEENGRTDGLVDLYQRFIVAEPENPRAYAEMGELLLNQGDYSGAVEAFLSAEAFGTEEPYPYYYLARLDFNRETPGAEHISRLHLAIGKAVRKISMIKIQASGIIKNQQGEVDAAELEKLGQLSELSEQPRWILQKSIDMLMKCYPDPGDFEKDIRRLIDWYPHTPELRSPLGILLEEEQRFSEALLHWQSVLADFPTAVEAHIGLGRSLKALGKPRQAGVALRRARDLDPENHEIYHLLELLYTAEGKEQELLQLYCEFYERERTNTALIYARASLEKNMGLLEEASQHRSRAEELEESN